MVIVKDRAYVTRVEAAQMLGLAPESLRVYMWDGRVKLDHITLGNAHLYPLSQVQAEVERRQADKAARESMKSGR